MDPNQNSNGQDYGANQSPYPDPQQPTAPEQPQNVVVPGAVVAPNNPAPAPQPTYSQPAPNPYAQPENYIYAQSDPAAVEYDYEDETTRSITSLLPTIISLALVLIAVLLILDLKYKFLSF